ncbi:hypothetical protein ACWGA9_32280 [Streptomyces sp. NPDC054950]
MNSAPPPGATRAVTVWSLAGLGLLLPIVVLAWMTVLSTPRGGRCLMYGEQCSAVPGEALYGCFFGTIAAGLLALAWPRDRWAGVRAGVVLLQWGAQLTLGALILSAA